MADGQELQVDSQHSIVDLNEHWRDIAVSNFTNNTVQIGGAVYIVERCRRACFPDENATNGESYQSSGFLEL